MDVWSSLCPCFRAVIAESIAALGSRPPASVRLNDSSFSLFGAFRAGADVFVSSVDAEITADIMSSLESFCVEIAESITIRESGIGERSSAFSANCLSSPASPFISFGFDAPTVTA